MTPTLALTVRQPWAWAIVYGGKDVENRSWTTSYRGPIYIHAAAKRRPIEERFFAEWTRQRKLVQPFAQPDLVHGALIATANILAVMKDHPSQWAIEGCFHFVLDRVVPLRRPIPCPGALGLWTVPSELRQR